MELVWKSALIYFKEGNTMGNFQNLIGMRFTRLVVQARGESSKGGRVRWHVLCDCGNERVVRASTLKNGDTTSCGCFRKEHASAANTTHGGSGSRMYRIWAHMIQRCTNSNTLDYKWYGGRGIRVCETWLDPAVFLAWANQFTPFRDMTIDRINNDGPYSPENCQWLLNSENIRKSQNQAVMCLETGERFDSAKLAAASLGYHRTAVSVAIWRNRKCAGLTWKYI